MRFELDSTFINTLTKLNLRWMRDRITRMWPQWAAAAKQFAAEGSLRKPHQVRKVQKCTLKKALNTCSGVLIYHTKILIVMWRFFCIVDREVSLCKLSSEYFLLWVINMSLYGNTNTSTLPSCTNKIMCDKSLHNK